MRRRELLRGAGTAALAGLVAGCTARRSTDGDTGGDGTTTTTPEPEPSLTGSELMKTDSGCASDGGGGGSATVSFDEGAGSVDVEGEMSASDPCHRAVLRSVEFDSGADELTVTVGLEETGADVCTQCVAEVTYSAVARFENGLPGSVTVRHGGESGGEVVTTASR